MCAQLRYHNATRQFKEKGPYFGNDSCFRLWLCVEWGGSLEERNTLIRRRGTSLSFERKSLSKDWLPKLYIECRILLSHQMWLAIYCNSPTEDVGSGNTYSLLVGCLWELRSGNQTRLLCKAMDLLSGHSWLALVRVIPIGTVSQG